jgi:exonuclease SbcC
MLETAEIKYYQRHEHSILEFDKGLNVIKGTSHSGKSSIWRALNWALQNRPLGEGFRSYFAPKGSLTSTGLEFNDAVIFRNKSDKENSYLVNGKELKAIKSDLPDEVLEASQMNEVNLQGQDDPYFLILDSPGSVARKLNEAVGLDIIDESMSKVNSIVSKANLALKIIDEDIFKAENDLESLAWIDEVGPKILKVQQGLQKKEWTNNRLYHLNKKMEEIRDCEDRIKEYSYWLKVEDHYINLMWKFEKREKLRVDIGRLKYLIMQVTEYSKAVERDKEWLSVEDKYVQLSQKVTRRQQLLVRIRQLKSVCKRIDEAEIVVNSANKHVRNLQSKYDSLLKSTNACPLCGRAW